MKNQSTEYRTQSTENPPSPPFAKGGMGGFDSELRIPNSEFTQSGSALVVTLLLVTILTSLAVEFAYEVYIGTSASSNWQNAQKASLLSKSGQVLSLNYIKDLKNQHYTYQREIDVPLEKVQEQILGEVGTDSYREEGSLIIKIVDENSKFNINSIIMENGVTNNDALHSLKRLFEYLNIDPSLVMFIADWIDPDSEPRLRGSEDNAKNLPLWSVDELKLINGIDKKTFETISTLITVYGDRNIPQININTAELPVLVSLHENMTETLAKRIIDYRESSPFEVRGQIGNVSGLGDVGTQIQSRITTKSSYFRVITMATVNEITRKIESVIDNSMYIKYWKEI